MITAAVLAVAAPAYADYVQCAPTGDPCWVVVTTPDGGDKGGGGTVGSGCSFKGQDVPCHRADWGWFNSNDGCYWQEEVPQPPAGDNIWAGHARGGGDGSIWRYSCLPDGIGGGAWQPFPPPGSPGAVSAATLAAQMIKDIPMHGPAIGTAPDSNGSGLVGLPVWLWTTVSRETWGPISTTASVPGLSVTATARASKIEWRMGDGNSVTCANPGTSYTSSYGAQPSPTCGFVYQSPSRNEPDGRFQITAVTTWQVDWAGGGQTGSITVTRQSNSTITINELQVVTR